MTKADLRRHFRQRRRAVSGAEAAELNQVLTERFFAEIDLASVRFLHAFLTAGHLREVNTLPLLTRLHAEFPGIQLVVPKTEFETGQLTHVTWQPGEPLLPNAYGLPEPTGGQNVFPDQLDLILVPLLAFDRRGQRVGYGGGFYDRFLAQCRPDALKLGLSWFDPVDEISDADAHDVRLDACLTPQTLHRFSGAFQTF
jgi:5-formyltetrahydrofolate cyclo-ligase